MERARNKKKLIPRKERVPAYAETHDGALIFEAQTHIQAAAASQEAVSVNTFRVKRAGTATYRVTRHNNADDRRSGESFAGVEATELIAVLHGKKTCKLARR